MKAITNILILLFAGIQLISAQSFADLPKIVPAYSEDIDNSKLPYLCFENIFEDTIGYLWLPTCGFLKNKSKIFLVQFDGYDYHIVEEGLDKLQSADFVSFVDIGSSGELIGFADYGELRKPFVYNTSTRHFLFLSLQGIDTLAVKIISVKQTQSGNISLLTQTHNQFSLYTISDSPAELRGTFSVDNPEPSPTYFPIAHNEDEIWLLSEASNYIYWNNKNNHIKIFNKEDFFHENIIPNPFNIKNILINKFYIKTNNKTYFSVPSLNKNNFFVLEKNSNQLRHDARVPKVWKALFFESDKKGNTLFVFEDENSNYHCILEDAHAQLFDYSAMVSDIEVLRNIRSEDFKKEILINSMSGLRISVVKENQIIRSYLKDQPIRSIVMLKNDHSLIKRSGESWVILDRKGTITTSISKDLCAEIDPGASGKEITADEEGNCWAMSKGKLIKYDTKLDSCEVFHLNNKLGSHLTFVGRNRFASFIDGCLYISDIESKTSVAVLLAGGEQLCALGAVGCTFYDPDGVLWVSTDRDFWKIDIPSEGEKILAHPIGLKKYRIGAIHKDKIERLWLGTFNNGVQIYDPLTGDVQFVDQSKGLCNDIVVSILEDAQGVIWLGTFNGISLVSPAGKVLANIFESDGLTYNECNQFAAQKTSDNKLLIGTLRGLNLIDPVLLKAKILKKEKAKIFLTSLSYYNVETERDTVHGFNFKNIAPVILPASQRYLNLSFSLTSHIESDKNQFAYMLKGIDKDWTAIGTQHKLNLNNLAAGRYTLLVKGRDVNGIWSSNQLLISIWAKDFFYNQVWFYLLCALLFVLLALLRIWRMQAEKASMAIEIEKATHEIRKDKELIEAQADQLRELDRAKSRFFTNISHEFRTPLTIISGMSDQIKNKPELWLEKGTQMIKQNTNNLLNLVNQILDLRKLESQNLEMNYVQGDIISYLRYIASSFEPYAENKGIQMHFLTTQTSLQMDYDADKLLRIISNLLSNAIKYTPVGGNIYFHTELKKESERAFFQMRIEDTGAGIAGDKLPDIFDRFYQVDDSSTRKGEGTGIGLALVKELVKLMQGEVKVSSIVEKGSTFVIQLPISNNSSIQNAPTAFTEGLELSQLAASEQILHHQSTAEKPKLLIVEDNIDVVQFLIACLEDQYQLLFAENGKIGIDMALEQVPDLIVSDVMMPEKNGFELCEALKNDERSSHIPIVLLTAKADMDSKISGLAHGADAYLAKPFEPRELHIHLKKLIELRRKLQERYRSFESSETQPDIEDAFIQKVRQAIEDNIANENFGIAQLCRAIALSRAQLHNKIKALTGTATSSFIRSVRLRRAKYLLETTKLNVSEVAYEVGFKNPTYFSTAYSEEFGSPPSKTRK